MTIDPAFLRAVQKSGWRLVYVGEESCVAACPRDGCKTKMEIVQGQKYPPAWPGQTNFNEGQIGSFTDAREFLRAHRERLALTISEVEEVAGMAVDYLAKWEKDDPSKIPNTQTFLEWAQALGFDVVLRPAELPPLALRIISGTRDKVASRTKRQASVSERRVKG